MIDALATRIRRLGRFAQQGWKDQDSAVSSVGEMNRTNHEFRHGRTLQVAPDARPLFKRSAKV